MGGSQANPWRPMDTVEFQNTLWGPRPLGNSLDMLLLLLELTAAFYMVDHDLLTHRLTNVGIHGVVLKWLISFLYS